MAGATLKAFHGDRKVKAKYLARVRGHMLADHLVRGQGWDPATTKGCAIGCTLEAYEHARYETDLGIPEWLARLEDTLFEGMSVEKSKTWPEKFLKACWTGADLEQAKVPIVCMIMEHSLQSLRATKYDAAKFPNVKAAIEQTEAAVAEMIRCQRGGLHLTAAARSAAASAAWSAASAARSAASAAESAAWSAAASAAASARSAARSAESAAWSAARSAESAAWSAARSAESAAWSAAYDYYADRVLSILRSIRV